MGVAMLRKLYLALTALSVVICVGATSSRGALLNPNGSVVPTGSLGLAGNLVADTGVVPFVSVDATSFSGTLQTRVWNNNPANPFGPNLLTFTFFLTNNGPDPLERLTTINYTGYSTDANFATDGPAGAIPTTVDRNSTGKIVGWDYSGGVNVPPGGNSALLVLHTNATDWDPVINSVINGSVATVNSYGPAPIPEPGTLCVIGLSSLILVARRRVK
jgi:hypothetical protein